MYIVTNNQKANTIQLVMNDMGFSGERLIQRSHGGCTHAFLSLK